MTAYFTCYFYCRSEADFLKASRLGKETFGPINNYNSVYNSIHSNDSDEYEYFTGVSKACLGTAIAILLISVAFIGIGSFLYRKYILTQASFHARNIAGGNPPAEGSQQMPQGALPGYSIQTNPAISMSEQYTRFPLDTTVNIVPLEHSAQWEAPKSSEVPDSHCGHEHGHMSTTDHHSHNHSHSKIES